MSSVMRPVGPERPVVYWFRRGVIAAIVIAVVLLVVHVVGGGSPSAGTGATPGSHGASPQPSVTPSPGIGRCRAGDLTAALATDKSQYAAGEQATFTATISNTSGTPCRWRSTAARRVWTVTSGHDTIWSTTGCPHSGSPTTARLTATRTAKVSITWDAHRNDSSCTTGATALPGTYLLSATIGGVTAKPVVFHVVS